GPKRGEHVDVVHLQPTADDLFVRGRLDGVDAAGTAGVRDDRGERPLPHRVTKGLRPRGRGEVGGDVFTTGFFGEWAQPLLAPRDGDDRHALPAQIPHGRLADAGGGSGDHN